MHLKILLLLCLALCCIAPTWAQDEPATSVFDELPPCREDVYNAYAAEIVLDAWVLYQFDASTVVDPWWSSEHYLSGDLTPGFNMPPCKNALALRDMVMLLRFQFYIAQQARYGNGDTADRWDDFIHILMASTVEAAPDLYVWFKDVLENDQRTPREDWRDYDRD